MRHCEKCQSDFEMSIEMGRRHAERTWPFEVEVRRLRRQVNIACADIMSHNNGDAWQDSESRDVHKTTGAQLRDAQKRLEVERQKCKVERHAAGLDDESRWAHQAGHADVLSPAT